MWQSNCAADDSLPTLVDDVGGWLTAAMDRADAWTGGSVQADIDDLVDAVAGYEADLVLVSPEVGLTVVPETAAGRRFADELGALNQRLAELCDRVVLVVAGTAGHGEGTVVTEFPPITAPDEDVAAQARTRQDTLTKPAGSLGRLEELSVWVAACQGACPPNQFQRARIVVFAGDHGVTAAGVSAFPAEVTAQMVANFDAGGAAINVLAEAAGATVRVADIAVDVDEPHSASIGAHKVRRGSGNIAVEDALTADEAQAAVEAGRRIADEEVDAGADLLIAGDMGIGNTTAATALIAALTGAEPVVVVGRGTGINDAGWSRKVAAVRDALYRARGLTADPARAATGVRWRGSGCDGGILRTGGGTPDTGAARRSGGDVRRDGRRRACAWCARLVACRSSVHRTRPHAGPGEARNSNRSSISRCVSVKAPAQRSHCRSYAPPSPHCGRWPRSMRPASRRDPFGHRGVRVRHGSAAARGVRGGPGGADGTAGRRRRTRRAGRRGGVGGFAGVRVGQPADRCAGGGGVADRDKGPAHRRAGRHRRRPRLLRPAGAGAAGDARRRRRARSVWPPSWW